MTLVALLSFGMFAAPTLLITLRIVTRYNFYSWFLLNYIPHFAMSLWGVYLVKSKQVSLRVKDCLIGGGSIVAFAFVMFLVNILCGTAYFGLSVGDGYNIYGFVLVPDAYVSALIYFLGLLAVLLIGFGFQKMLKSRKS